MQNKIKTLLIDLDHTLWDFETNSKIALKEALSMLDLLDQIEDYDYFFDVYEEINTSYWAKYRKREIDRDKLIIGRFEDTFEKVLPNARGCGLRLNDVYLECMPRQSKLLPGALDFLKYASKKYKIVLVTNGFRKVQWQKIYTSKIDQYVDHMVVSEDVGVPKPSPKIFQYALSCANAKRTEAIMIGDSFEADVMGAIAMKIPTIYFAKQTKESFESDYLLTTTVDWDAIRNLL
ncbi:MAG: YjjG family noncanonical pyrimidine nucleotidase [Prolixibacteraceae bacterium]|jgi:putative hydrolase of the HAD superfamily|nr:YjjG family noncanonical pyrimidine nucleotidase [Prolixibacteraceae bacterium]